MRAITQADVFAAIGRIDALKNNNPHLSDGYLKGWNDALDLAYRELLDAFTTEPEGWDADVCPGTPRTLIPREG